MARLIVSPVVGGELLAQRPGLLHHVEPGAGGAGEAEQADAEAVLPAPLDLLDEAVLLERGHEPERRALVHLEGRGDLGDPDSPERARISRIRSARSTDCTPDAVSVAALLMAQP